MDGADEVDKQQTTRFSYNSQRTRLGCSGAEEGHKSHFQGELAGSFKLGTYAQTGQSQETSLIQ